MLRRLPDAALFLVASRCGSRLSVCTQDSVCAASVSRVTTICAGSHPSRMSVCVIEVGVLTLVDDRPRASFLVDKRGSFPLAAEGAPAGALPEGAPAGALPGASALALSSPLARGALTLLCVVLASSSEGAAAGAIGEMGGRMRTLLGAMTRSGGQCAPTTHREDRAPVGDVEQRRAREGGVVYRKGKMTGGGLGRISMHLEGGSGSLLHGTRAQADKVRSNVRQFESVCSSEKGHVCAHSVILGKP